MNAERRRNELPTEEIYPDGQDETIDRAREPDMEREPREMGSSDLGNGTLMPPEVSGDFRSRWESIQTAFVDDPRGAVSQADDMVGEVMDRLRATFEDQRGALDSGWSDDGDDSSTEELRNAFRRYRSFFERLLTT